MPKAETSSMRYPCTIPGAHAAYIAHYAEWADRIKRDLDDKVANEIAAENLARWRAGANISVPESMMLRALGRTPSAGKLQVTISPNDWVTAEMVTVSRIV